MDPSGLGQPKADVGPPQLDLDQLPHPCAPDQTQGRAGQKAQLHETASKGTFAAQLHEAGTLAGGEITEQGQRRFKMRFILKSLSSTWDARPPAQKGESPLARREPRGGDLRSQASMKARIIHRVFSCSST